MVHGGRKLQMKPCRATVGLNLLPDKQKNAIREKVKSLKGNLICAGQKSTTVTGNQLILRQLHSHTCSKRQEKYIWIANIFWISTYSKVNPYGPKRSVLFQRRYVLWSEHEIVMRPDNGTSTYLDIGTIHVERKPIWMIKKKCFSKCWMDILQCEK